MDDETKAKIDRMTIDEMARIWRFAPSGHPMMQGDTFDYFNARFQSLGGWTPGLSKRIGWDG